jgi:thiosulfate/3-mercaptopyruvate sulfurtransferase
MKYFPLISCKILARHLNNPAWVIVDCRFLLDKPEWGIQDYLRAHIPGAIYLDLNKQLSSSPQRNTGRHPLPDMVQFQQLLSEVGISPTKQVVVYDTVGGAYASRLWWMLRYLRFPFVSLLNGGFSKWLELGFPTTTGNEKSIPSRFDYHLPDESFLATTIEMERIFNDPSYTIVDSRSLERYLGENEPIDPIAGHIPHAVNRFHGADLNPDMTFKNKLILKAEFQRLIRSLPEKTVFYCGSGVTSCLQTVAMEYAGLPGSRIYIGSWSEWIRDPDHPIASIATSSTD